MATDALVVPTGLESIICTNDEHKYIINHLFLQYGNNNLILLELQITSLHVIYIASDLKQLNYELEKLSANFEQY